MAAKLGCVVVAVDSSEESMNALKWALDNLKLNSEQLSALTILHVQPPPSISAGVNPGAIPFGGLSSPEVPAFTAAIEAHQKRISEAIIDHALKICSEKKSQMKIKTQVIVGDPKEVICQVVEQLHADLLVMGSHSFGPIKRCLFETIQGFIQLTNFVFLSRNNKSFRMFLGSVSNYCANQAQCPVMVVKASTKHSAP